MVVAGPPTVKRYIRFVITVEEPEDAVPLREARTAVPPQLTTGPQYGLAVMKDARPEGAQLALAILATNGLKPVIELAYRRRLPVVS